MRKEQLFTGWSSISLCSVCTTFKLMKESIHGNGPMWATINGGLKFLSLPPWVMRVYECACVWTTLVWNINPTNIQSEKAVSALRSTHNTSTRADMTSFLPFMTLFSDEHRWRRSIASTIKPMTDLLAQFWLAQFWHAMCIAKSAFCRPCKRKLK